jgi:arylsulfatase
MATCVDVSGATYPASFRGRDILPMEGLSLVPAFSGRTLEREAVYFEHEGNRAVLTPERKLVARGRNGPWELYDMILDRTETRDLAGERPEEVRRMGEMWDAWALRARVLS